SFRFVLLLVLVLLLDFAGDFEDEDDDVNKEDCASGYFLNRLLSPLHGPDCQRAGEFGVSLALREAERRERRAPSPTTCGCTAVAASASWSHHRSAAVPQTSRSRGPFFRHLGR